MPGRPWTQEEETQLKELAEQGLSADDIAAKLQRNRDAILVKARRLGIARVVGGSLAHTTTTDIKLPLELPTPEEALKLLAGALQIAKEKGLDKIEVERLKAIAQLARTYDALLDKYVGYRRIEENLIRLDQKYKELTEHQQEKAKDHERMLRESEEREKMLRAELAKRDGKPPVEGSAPAPGSPT